MRQNSVMRVLVVVTAVFGFLGSMVCLPATAGTETGVVAEGKILPKFKLDIPTDPEMKQYLGADGEKGFTLDQLHSRLIVVEAFSVMCPACHQNAPSLNKLYNIISGDPELKSDIVMIGIALDNDAKLVSAFEKKFKVKFPLFPDPDGEIDKTLTGVSTPTLMILDNTGKVLFVHVGIIDDMDSILTVIRSLQES